MKNCAPERIRNFVVVGHAGAGKTALADLMLFKAGAVSRQGSVDNGTSVSDFRKEEQERKSSIYSAVLNCAWKDGHFFFVDTPGSTDFCGEALNAIGLDVPECAKLAKRLRDAGFDIPMDAYRMEDVAGYIIDNIGKGRRGA